MKRLNKISELVGAAICGLMLVIMVFAFGYGMSETLARTIDRSLPEVWRSYSVIIRGDVVKNGQRERVIIRFNAFGTACQVLRQADDVVRSARRERALGDTPVLVEFETPDGSGMAYLNRACE